jgi:predicted GNAT family N-acyltransferase
VRDFYARYGYVARGDVFMEAGIPHVMMARAMEGATA